MANGVKYIQSALRVILAASLLASSIDAVAAVAAFQDPAFTPLTVQIPHPGRFQEQALSAGPTVFHPLLKHLEAFPFIGRLYRSNAAETPPSVAPDSELQARRERTEERLLQILPPRQELYAAAAIFVIGILTAQAFGFLNPSSLISIACGDAAVVALAKQWPLRRLLMLGDRAIALIDYRGRQSGGWVAYFDEGSVRARVKNPKRGNLAKNMSRMFRLVWGVTWILARLTARPLQSPVVQRFHGHVRQATASLSTWLEAHPHQWVRRPLQFLNHILIQLNKLLVYINRKFNKHYEWLRGRPGWVWTLQDGALTATLRYVRNTISHNGDFDDIQSWWHDLTPEQQAAIENSPLINVFGRTLSQKEAGKWLNKVFHTTNRLKGDSPKIAGFIDLFHTQGQWNASARLAWVTLICQSPADEPLTEKELRALSRVLETVFEKEAATILPPGAKRFSEATPEARQRLEAAILAALEQTRWSEVMHGRQEAFAHAAMNAFLDNDLRAATHEFMKRAIGTFGLVITSSIAKDRMVIASRRQPLRVGIAADGTIAGTFSAQAAAKLPLFDFAVDADLRGEILEIGVLEERGVFVNAFPERIVTDPAHLNDPVRQIPWETIRDKRLIPLHGSALVEPLREDFGEDPVGTNVKEMAAVAPRIEQAWNRSTPRGPMDYDGFPLQTAAESSPFFLTIPLEQEVNRYIPIHYQTAAFQDWLAPQLLEVAKEALAGRIPPSRMRLESERLIQKAEAWVQANKHTITEESEEDRPIQILMYGYENPLWAVEQVENDMDMAHAKKRLLNLRSTSANKLASAFRTQPKNPQRRYPIPRVGVVTPQTVMISATYSGETSATLNGTVNYMDKMDLVNDSGEPILNHRVFAIMGEVDTPLATVIGQRFTAGSEFYPHIIPMLAGRRPAEPSDVAALATHLTLTELELHWWEDYLRVFPEDFDPIGLRLRMPQLQELHRRQKHLVEKEIPLLVGHDAEGNPIESEAYQNIDRMTTRWALRMWDASIAAIMAGLYVILTVHFHVQPFGHVLGLLAHAAGYSISTNTQSWIDVLSYLFLIKTLSAWAFRLLTLRPSHMFARIANPTVFLADAPHLYQTREMHLTKLGSLAQSWWTFAVYGASARDHFLAREGHRGKRGDLFGIGMPDERMAAMTSLHGESAITATQMFGNSSIMGSTIETVSTGRGPKETALFQAHLKLPDVPPPPDDLEITPALERLIESRMDAGARMVSDFVFDYLWIRKVTLNGRLWDYSRTQGGARTFTTATPVSAAQSTLWGYLIKRGWVTKEQAARWAFLESIFFSGILLALPLALLPASMVDAYRPGFVLVNSFIFGFFGHRRNLTQKIFLGAVINAGFLRPGSSGLTDTLIAIGLHFLINNAIPYIWNLLFPIEPIPEDTAPKVGTPRIFSLYEKHPGIITPEPPSEPQAAEPELRLRLEEEVHHTFGVEKPADLTSVQWDALALVISLLRRAQPLDSREERIVINALEPFLNLPITEQSQFVSDMQDSVAANEAVLRFMRDSVWQKPEVAVRDYNDFARKQQATLGKSPTTLPQSQSPSNTKIFFISLIGILLVGTSGLLAYYLVPHLMPIVNHYLEYLLHFFHHASPPPAQIPEKTVEWMKSPIQGFASLGFVLPFGSGRWKRLRNRKFLQQAG